MKQRSVRTTRLYALFSAAAGLLLGIARILISRTGMDPGIEMYRLDCTAANFLHIALIVCGVLAFSVMLPVRRNAPVIRCEKPSKPSMYFSLFTAFMLLAYDLILVLNLARDDFAGIGPLIGRTPLSMTGQATVTLASAIFLSLLILAAVPASVFYFKCAYVEQGKEGSFAGFSTAPVVWFILYALHNYFDPAVAFNSPVKVLRLVVILVFMLYAIQEARFIVGAPIPYLYYAAADLALLFGFMISISDAVLYAMNIISLPEGYLMPALAFFLTLYVLARVLSAEEAPVSDAVPAEPAEAEVSEADIPAADTSAADTSPADTSEEDTSEVDSPAAETEVKSDSAPNT